jgi:hypothetical protein
MGQEKNTQEPKAAVPSQPQLSPLLFILPVDKSDIQARIDNGEIFPPDGAQQDDLYVLKFNRFQGLQTVLKAFKDTDFYKTLPIESLTPQTALTLVRVNVIDQKKQFVIIDHVWVQELGYAVGLSGKQALIWKVYSEEERNEELKKMMARPAARRGPRFLSRDEEETKDVDVEDLSDDAWDDDEDDDEEDEEKPDKDFMDKYFTRKVDSLFDDDDDDEDDDNFKKGDDDEDDKGTPPPLPV